MYMLTFIKFTKQIFINFTAGYISYIKQRYERRVNIYLSFLEQLISFAGTPT